MYTEMIVTVLFTVLLISRIRIPVFNVHFKQLQSESVPVDEASPTGKGRDQLVTGRE